MKTSLRAADTRPLTTWRDAENQMAWVQPAYSTEEVNAAGRVLVRAFSRSRFELGNPTYDELMESMDIVNNFRSSHNFPLNTFQNNLRVSARRFDENALIAQRIKRLVSIRKKLDRSPTMKLSQMQDIGGCRAVLSSVAKARQLVAYYQTASRMKHDPRPMDDYIEHPKASGYRGVHLIYRYQSDRNNTYNNLKIEMQIRSQYQHAWATAVETAGMFLGQALKTSIGDQKWLRFFALAGSAFAKIERTPTIPNTPENRAELRDELLTHAFDLNVFDRLDGYRQALRYVTTNAVGAHWFLLELDPVSETLNITGFDFQDRDFAESAYASAEKRVAQNPSTDAVLVSVDNVNKLERAYPNYFADTLAFSNAIRSFLRKRR